MTEDTGAPKSVQAPELTALGDLIAKVTTNPAALPFPTDVWGFTSDVRKYVLKAASKVQGQDDKHDLLIGTLAVLITHIKLRKDSDKAQQAKRLQEIQDAADERLPRERVGGVAVAKKETE